MITASFSKSLQTISLTLHFGILHDSSFWNDSFLPFETLDKKIQSYLDTTLSLLSLLFNNLMRKFSTQELESEIKIYFEER